MEQNQLVGVIAMAIYGAVMALIGGTSAVVVVGMLARYFLNSPVAIAWMENAFNSASPDLIKALRPTSELAYEITDGIPAADKQKSAGSSYSFASHENDPTPVFRNPPRGAE